MLRKLVTSYQKWYQNDNKIETCYQKRHQSGNMLPKMIINDNKMVKYCKNGNMLTNIVKKW